MKEEEQASSFIPVVKSSSENKVYEIGNRYKPSSEEMVVLTGKVTDFKSGQNLEGINIVHREPWVATATEGIRGILVFSFPSDIISLKSMD